MFTITFHLFAYPREKLNKSTIIHTFTTGLTISQLIVYLSKEYPNIPFERYRYAISQTYIKDLERVCDTDTDIYIIPPISGG